MDILVHKAKNGDKEAFMELVKPLEKKLYVIAKAKIDNEEDVKDAIQETLLSSYKNIKNLNDSEKFESWITTILLNNCNKYYKKNKNVIQIPLEDNNSIVDLDDNYSKLEHKLDFFKYVELLDEDEKNIFLLYYNNDMTTKKISDVLGINENTIKTKLRRSRQKVQIYIERWNECGE